MSENPRRGRQARNFTTNVPKILDLKSSSEQIFFRKLSLGAPGCRGFENYCESRTEIQGKSILVRVGTKFELSGVDCICG